MQKQSTLNRFFSSAGNGIKMAIMQAKEPKVPLKTPSDVMKENLIVDTISEEKPKPESTAPRKIHEEANESDELFTTVRSGKKKLRYIDDDEEEEYYQPVSSQKTTPNQKATPIQKTEPKSRKGGLKKTKDEDSDFEIEKEVQDEQEDDVLDDDVLDDDDDFIEEDDEESDKKKKKGRGRKAKDGKTPPPKAGNTGGATGGGRKRKTATPTTAKQSKLLAQQTVNFSKGVSNEENVFFNPEAEQGKTFNINDFEDKTPDWATLERRKDANMRRAQDPDFDPTTLYIPPEEKKKLTPTMRQYWEIKSEHMDKVIFFKLGKFYELFYEDALVGNKYLDLNWMGRKMHTGFPERTLEKMAEKLIDFGFKIAVVEQTETPKEMEQRLKNSAKKTDKTIKREIVQVLTKGTYSSNIGEKEIESKYLLCIKCEKDNVFSFVCLESTTNYLIIGSFKDNEHFTNIKTLLFQFKPSEVVYDIENVNKELLKALKNTYFKPQHSIITNKQNKWHPGVSKNNLERLYGDRAEGRWPAIFEEYIEQSPYCESMYSALSGCLSYLEKVLILDRVLNTARFLKYDTSLACKTCMMVDSQALQHLEILETQNFSSKNTQEGSLLHFLDKAISPFGKRLLKKWICAPLMNINHINQRLDAVEDLAKHDIAREKFRNGLHKLPDLERMCTRLYQYSVKQSTKVVYFEDVSKIRLKEFRSLLKNLRAAENLIKEISKVSNDFRSTRLKRMVTYIATESESSIPIKKNDIYLSDTEEGTEEQPKTLDGLLPHSADIITEMENMIHWEGKDGETPIPAPGILTQYDELKEKIKECDKEFKNYLQGIRKRLGDHTIDYSHAKYRYELEIPEKLVQGNKKPADFEFTSQRQGFQRFHIEDIKTMVEDLETLEDQEKNMLKTFVEFLFTHFYQKYQVWDAIINIIAELDCLCSLSVVSFLNVDMCRPVVLSSDEPFIEIKQMRHPTVANQSKSFVSNDFSLGFKEDDVNQSLMLLTGPNMGGKSTLLRTVCLTAIMAQIGCYVPAKNCTLSVVDRIFTRIGASDKLMEGKSTFYIEMEETVNVLNHGSKHSLVIMDELGRGTSTFDGVAIAYSVLKYLVEKLKCRTLFATHYHILIEEFRNYKEIEFCHMAAMLDDKNEKVIFLYKLVQGECLESFGINVAKIVGIPNDILVSAKKKAAEFKEKLSLQMINDCNKKFNQVVNCLSTIKKNENNLKQLEKLFMNLNLIKK